MEAPIREARRDARLELQRRGEEEAPQRQPGGIVVGGAPCGRLEAERAEQPSGVGEPRRDDVAVADAHPVAQHLLEHDFDHVAGLQIAVEIDVAGEQLGDPDRQADVLAGPLERGDERRVLAIDVTADRDQRDFAAVGHDLGGEPRRAGLPAEAGSAKAGAPAGSDRDRCGRSARGPGRPGPGSANTAGGRAAGGS